MKTIAIPQFYCGPSGQKGLYNRQEVGLARAFAALGCRAVVLYPAPGAAAPTVENPEPNVKIYYLPVQKLGAQAFFSSWQVLLDEQVDAVTSWAITPPACRRSTASAANTASCFTASWAR